MSVQVQPAATRQIPLDKINEVKQVREHFDEESLVGFAQNLRENGLIAPVQVQPLADGRFNLVVGGRRVRAARMAGWTSIAAIVVEGELKKGDLLARQLSENAQREDLTPAEKARAFDAIIKETGLSASQVAAKQGISNASMTRILSLLMLPPELQERVGKDLPASAAYELSQISDPAQRAAYAEQLATGKLTRDALRGARKAKGQPDASTAVGSQPTRATAKLGDGRSVTVCAKGLTLESFLANLEDVRVRAREARGKNLSLDTFLKVLRDQSRQ